MDETTLTPPVEVPPDTSLQPPVETPPVEPPPAPDQQPDYTVNSEDLIPPELMAKLKEAASSGLNGHQMLSLAALAFSNPNKAWELVQQHESKKDEAEKTLLDLGVRAKGMEVQLKKQAIVQGQADKKAKQAAEAADKKDAAAQQRADLAAATTLIGRDKGQGIQVPGEITAELLASVGDTEKFAAAMGKYSEAAGKGQRKVAMVSGLKAAQDDVIRGGDPDVAIAASGITEEDMADPQIRAAVSGLRNMAKRYQQERAAIEWRKNQAIEIQASRARSAAETAAARNRAATAVKPADITRELSVQNAIRNNARKAYEVASREFLSYSNNGDDAAAADAQSRMADATSEMAASTEMIKDLEERQRSAMGAPKTGLPLSQVLPGAMNQSLAAASKASGLTPEEIRKALFTRTLSENPMASRTFFDTLRAELAKGTGRNPRDFDAELRSEVHNLANLYYANLGFVGEVMAPGNASSTIKAPDESFVPPLPPEAMPQGPQQ